MAWLNTIDNTVSGGDQPVGNYFVKIPDAPNPFCHWDGEQWIQDDVAAHNTPIDTEIAAAEAALPITPRALREFMLMVLQFARIDPSVNPKFSAIALLDQHVQELRSQRK